MDDGIRRLAAAGAEVLHARAHMHVVWGWAGSGLSKGLRSWGSNGFVVKLFLSLCLCPGPFSLFVPRAFSFLRVFDMCDRV